MYVSLNSNIIFSCYVKDKDSAALWDICQFWVHIKSNKLKPIDK